MCSAGRTAQGVPVTGDCDLFLEAQAVFSSGEEFKAEVRVPNLDPSCAPLMLDVCGRMQNGPKDTQALILGTRDCDPQTEKCLCRCDEVRDPERQS